MLDPNHRSVPQRVLMLGTFSFQPKGTMSARALGLAQALQEHGVAVRIATVPWDNPAEAGTRSRRGNVECVSTRSFNPRYWPLPVRELVQEARQFQPDLIHLFKPKGFGDLAARILARRGVPIVVDMDDWEGTGGWNDVLQYSRVQRLVFDWQERSWPSRADALTVASRALRERAIELGANPEIVLYLPNGISMERFHQLADCSGTVPDDAPVSNDSGRRILLYTRFTEFDPQFAIAVLARIIERAPEVRLIVVGGSPDGRAEVRLRSSARAAGIESSVDSLGWIEPGDLGAIARQCQVAIVPFDDSLINRSKCSVKLLELMATGIPIVASNVGENRSYLAAGRLGELARPGDVGDHAARVLALIENQLAAIELGRSAQREVQSRYLWQSLISPLLDCYSAVLRERNRSWPET